MSGIVIWIGAVGVAIALAIGTARVGTAAIEQSQASSAADATALAAAAQGWEAAREVARRNGASLVAFSGDGTTFRVVVRVGDASVEAFAERYFVAISSDLAE